MQAAIGNVEFRSQNSKRLSRQRIALRPLLYHHVARDATIAPAEVAGKDLHLVLARPLQDETPFGVPESLVNHDVETSNDIH